MLPLLLALLKTLEEFFTLRNTRAKWELERDIAKYCDDLDDQIHNARARGTQDGDDLADRLHDRLLRSSKLSVASYASQQRDPAPQTGSGVSGGSK